MHEAYRGVRTSWGTEGWIQVVAFDAGPSLVWVTAAVGPRIPRPKAPDSAPKPVASR